MLLGLASYIYKSLIQFFNFDITFSNYIFLCYNVLLVISNSFLESFNYIILDYYFFINYSIS